VHGFAHADQMNGLRNRRAVWWKWRTYTVYKAKTLYTTAGSWRIEGASPTMYYRTVKYISPSLG